MSLNVWGMPRTPYKDERMKAIANEISKGEFDIYLLEELWMRYDHKDIQSKIPNGFFMTRYEELTGWSCLGNVLPTCK